MKEQIQKENREILGRLARFLNESARMISADMVAELARGCGFSEHEAYGMLLSAAIGLETDQNPHHRVLWNTYLPKILHRLSIDTYLNDPYLKAIRMPEKRHGRWRLGMSEYLPYEAFVSNDVLSSGDGRLYPQIGYFTECYRYPVVYENGREWMLITPNEIETMREPIAFSRGRVLTFGLGLGYFAFMASRKDSVQSLTVVERDQDVISLFREIILPQFPYPEKIEIICDDAFAFAEREMGKGKYDVVFCDLWHDVSDGLALYHRMKAYEKHSPESRFFYWIEKTMLCYESDLL